uniref:Putative secreted protein n=1 Tax=Ixodes ricinus TaxID=34613 RepID=A0A6B0UPZ7_IXORI
MFLRSMLFLAEFFYLGLLAYCLGLDLELDPLYWRIPKKLSCCQACKCSFWKICANRRLKFFMSIRPVRGLHKPIFRSPAQPGLLSPGPWPARGPLSIPDIRPGLARPDATFHAKAETRSIFAQYK